MGNLSASSPDREQEADALRGYVCRVLGKDALAGLDRRGDTVNALQAEGKTKDALLALSKIPQYLEERASSEIAHDWQATARRALDADTDLLRSMFGAKKSRPNCR